MDGWIDHEWHYCRFGYMSKQGVGFAEHSYICSIREEGIARVDIACGQTDSSIPKNEIIMSLSAHSPHRIFPKPSLIKTLIHQHSIHNPFKSACPGFPILIIWRGHCALIPIKSLPAQRLPKAAKRSRTSALRSLLQMKGETCVFSCDW